MATKKKPAASPDAPPAAKKKGSPKKVSPKAEPAAKKAPEVPAEPKPEPAAKAEPKPEAKAEPKAKVEPKPEAKAEPKAKAEPTPPPAEPPPEPEEPEVITFARDAERRSDEEEKAIRGLVKRGEKALDIIRDVFANFEPAPERAVKNALKRLADELDGLKPPEPRKCKEYKRALGLARRGEMGIHPDDIMKYCRCDECHALRDKAGLPHPPAPKMV